LRALVLVAPVSTSALDFVAPERFDALCHPTRDEQVALARAAFRHPPGAAELDALLAVIARATPEHIEGAARSMCDFTIAPELAALETRVLLLAGDRDSHVPLRNHLATWRAIRRCGLQVYFDVGHVPFQETPERFAEDVATFLSGLP
jgi:sigma-B regulation protein RsbQ